MNTCVKCGGKLPTQRHKFCSSHCKYWYNVIKREKEAHLPPKRKRNKSYFYMIVGSEWAKGSSRQGKRSGSMVVGAMAAMVRTTVEDVVEVNETNIKKHFDGIPGYIPNGLRLGDGTYIKREDVFKQLNIKL